MARFLKEKSGVGMFNATKRTYQLLTRILTFISYFELPNGRRCFGESENFRPNLVAVLPYSCMS